MPINQQFCLTHTSGKDIYLFTLRNVNDTEVCISNYGAILSAFKIKNEDDSFNDIVLGFDKIEDYWSPEYLKLYPWFGCSVGRYANRIKNASFSINESKYILSKNLGEDQLHGGINGFDKKIWTLVSAGNIPEPFLILKYLSADGEEGFPGNLDVQIHFVLSNEDELSYQYTATCDKPTAINLTHHSYFNLNNGNGTINDYELKIYASTILEQDERLFTNGNVISVENTAFDFSKFKRIADGLAMVQEYDKSYVINKDEISEEPFLGAELKSLKSKILLKVFTTDPIVHFYSGKWIPALIGKNKTKYGPFSGLCLETHKHPNAINIPQFPDTILRPDEVYKQKTIYKIHHI